MDARPHRLVHGNGRWGRAAGRPPGPAAYEERQHDEPGAEPRERHDPDEQVEALARRGEEDPEPVLVDEVGDAALFLLSPLSRGISGEVIYVDGGYHILGV